MPNLSAATICRLSSYAAIAASLKTDRSMSSGKGISHLNCRSLWVAKRMGSRFASRSCSQEPYFEDRICMEVIALLDFSLSRIPKTYASFYRCWTSTSNQFKHSTTLGELISRKSASLGMDLASATSGQEPPCSALSQQRTTHHNTSGLPPPPLLHTNYATMIIDRCHGARRFVHVISMQIDASHSGDCLSTSRDLHA